MGRRAGRQTERNCLRLHFRSFVPFAPLDPVFMFSSASKTGLSITTICTFNVAHMVFQGDIILFGCAAACLLRSIFFFFFVCPLRSRSCRPRSLAKCKANEKDEMGIKWPHNSHRWILYPVFFVNVKWIWWYHFDKMDRCVRRTDVWNISFIIFHFAVGRWIVKRSRAMPRKHLEAGAAWVRQQRLD